MLMNMLLIAAMVVLLVLVVLPFILTAPRASKDKLFMRDVLPPGHRRYSLCLPEGFTEGQKFPLVIALHFSGHGMPYYGELFLTDFIEPALRGLGAVIVAPDCPAKDWTQAESERFVLDLRDHLRDHFSIDPKRVLITGYSMGGIGTWHMASRFQDQFSAGLVMAANPPENAMEVEREFPLYVIHSREDELFPIVETTRFVVALEERGADINYRILEKATHFETHQFRDPLEEAVPWVLDQWKKRMSGEPN